MFSAFNPAWETPLENSWRRLGGLLRSVYTSRFPPRPLAGQRLEVAGQQLEAWKAPPESSWRWLGVSKTLSWRALGGSLSRLGGSWRALGASWAVLKTSGEVLGRPWGHIRGVLSALRGLPRQFSTIIGANRVTKWTPREGQNGVQNRVWLKMPQTLKP